MLCKSCNRRIADCECQKKNELVKHWPENTFLQKRLRKIRMEQLEEKPNTRDAGYSLIEVMCFFAIAGLMILVLITLATFARQVIENLHTAERCIQALLECVTI